MNKIEIMNDIVNNIGADRWEEKSFFGFIHFYVYKGIEIIEDFRSIYEANYYLKNVLKRCN